MKTVIAMAILFFTFVFGLPMGAMIKTAQIITGEENVEKITTNGVIPRKLRVFNLPEPERSAHIEFLKKIKDPIWTK